MERKKEIQVYRIELDEKTTINDYKKNRINQKIKSIILSRSSNPNVVVNCKLAEGDEFILIPGRVVNLKTPTAGIVFSWDSHPYEWAEFELSEDEHLVSFTPQSATSVASNISTKTVTKFIDYIEFVGGGGNGPEWQRKILDSNPNRVKAVVESFCWDRVFIGKEENTRLSTAYSVVVEKNDFVMPFCKKEFQSSEELYVLCDEMFESITVKGAGPVSGYLKVTEYIK